MKKRAFAAAMCLLTLAACGEGVQYAVDTYRDVPLAEFTDTVDRWRIFDRPDLSRMMVTPSIAAAAVQGATLNATAPTEAAALAAAQGFLSSTSRNCQATSVTIVAMTLYEATYTCA